MGYFDRLPMIGDNDCGGEATSVRITFAAGHEDYRGRRSFAVTVYLDDKEQADFRLPYDAARELIRALQADMRRDLARVEDVEEEP